MYLIGVDYHPSFQTMAFFVEETGECGEQELNHGDGQAEKFYRDLKQRGICVRVGMEATGYSRWFERLLAELGFELWIGDPAEKAKRVKKQKFDREPDSYSGCCGKTGSGESGSATTIVAPPSLGADQDFKVETISFRIGGQVCLRFKARLYHSSGSDSDSAFSSRGPMETF